jgi:hypothetical protein
MDLYPTIVHAWDEFLFPVFLYAFGIIGVLSLAGKSKNQTSKPRTKAVPEPVQFEKSPAGEPTAVPTPKRRGRKPKSTSASSVIPAKEVKPRKITKVVEVPDYSKGVCRDTLKCIFEET